MTEHTPTPWKVRKEIDGLHADWMTWIASGRKGVAVCNNQTRPSTFNSGKDEAEANARYIVRCVNNYDRLREALEKAAHCLEDAGYMGAYDSAHALLAELDNLEQTHD